jgi:hypothetical protein
MLKYISALLLFGLIGCSDNELLVPKPSTFLRTDLPTHTYSKLTEKVTYSFELSNVYFAKPVLFRNERTNHLEINLGKLNGVLYLNYYPIPNRDSLVRYINLSNDKVDEHQIKATGIKDMQLLFHLLVGAVALVEAVAHAHPRGIRALEAQRQARGAQAFKVLARHPPIGLLPIHIRPEHIQAAVHRPVQFRGVFIVQADVHPRGARTRSRRGRGRLTTGAATGERGDEQQSGHRGAETEGLCLRLLLGHGESSSRHRGCYPGVIAPAGPDLFKAKLSLK